MPDLREVPWRDVPHLRIPHADKHAYINKRAMASIDARRVTFERRHGQVHMVAGSERTTRLTLALYRPGHGTAHLSSRGLMRTGWLEPGRYHLTPSAYGGWWLTKLPEVAIRR